MNKKQSLVSNFYDSQKPTREIKLWYSNAKIFYLVLPFHFIKALYQKLHLFLRFNFLANPVNLFLTTVTYFLNVSMFYFVIIRPKRSFFTNHIKFVKQRALSFTTTQGARALQTLAVWYFVSLPIKRRKNKRWKRSSYSLV